MADKRKAKQSPVQLDDLSKPTAWRMQHGGFDPSMDTDPDTGAVVSHRRAVDTLGLMHANGTITPTMHDAGVIFRSLFRTAALDSMPTSQLLRVLAAGADAASERQTDARHRVAAALRCTGWACQPSRLLCVVRARGGVLAADVGDTAAWCGKPIHGPMAQGVLVATLGTLAMHFGLIQRSQAA